MKKYIYAIAVAIASFLGSTAVTSADEVPLNSFSFTMNELLNQAKMECQAIDNGIFKLGEGAVTKVDISGDGKLDEVLSYKDLKCSSDRYLIGSGGSLWSFIVDGHVESFDAKAWTLEPRPFENFPVPVLLLARHGTYCGVPGAMARGCVQALVWNTIKDDHPYIWKETDSYFLTGKEYQ